MDSLSGLSLNSSNEVLKTDYPVNGPYDAYDDALCGNNFGHSKLTQITPKLITQSFQVPPSEGFDLEPRSGPLLENACSTKSAVRNSSCKGNVANQRSLKEAVRLFELRSFF